jgi:hypothetical protein
MTRKEYDTQLLPEILEGRYAQALMTKDQYITSLEAHIAVLENEDPLGLNTADKLRIQLEERLDCTIHSSQMDLILEYIYDFLNHKESETPKTCEGCEYLSPETDDDYEFRWELHLPDYYKTKETK